MISAEVRRGDVEICRLVVIRDGWEPGLGFVVLMRQSRRDDFLNEERDFF